MQLSPLTVIRMVKAAVKGLDNKLQGVIRGIYFQGKSRVQIARELYISEVTVDDGEKKVWRSWEESLEGTYDLSLKNVSNSIIEIMAIILKAGLLCDIIKDKS